jgi:hypothetical protein
MKGPVLLQLFLTDFNFLNEFRNVLDNLIEFLCHLPICLEYVIEEISPIVKGRFTEGSEAKYLRLLKWEFVVQ